MSVLLVGLVAVFCACSAAYCAHIAKRLAPYKGRWLAAVRLLGELDGELQQAEQREQALVVLAQSLGAQNKLAVKRAEAIHAAVDAELRAARAERLAARETRKERAWAALTRDKP